MRFFEIKLAIYLLSAYFMCNLQALKKKNFKINIFQYRIIDNENNFYQR